MVEFATRDPEKSVLFLQSMLSSSFSCNDLWKDVQSCGGTALCCETHSDKQTHTSPYVAHGSDMNHAITRCSRSSTSKELNTTWLG
eukprot:6220362-Amphidinium_carterae.1